MKRFRRVAAIAAVAAVAAPAALAHPQDHARARGAAASQGIKIITDTLGGKGRPAARPYIYGGAPLVVARAATRE